MSMCARTSPDKYGTTMSKMSHSQLDRGNEEQFDPTLKLRSLAKAASLNPFSAEFAKMMDVQDELKHLRKEFCYPKNKELPKTSVDLSLVDGEEESVYFCGNSLGLRPKETATLVNQEMEKWARMGVFGHFEGKLPWKPIEESVKAKSAQLVGAKDIETVAMNSLTVNVHLMMVPFYRPTPQRYKILMEGKAFPSDIYAVQTQIRSHGYDPKDALVEVQPREGEDILRMADVVALIEEQGDSIALILFSGVQYYTGQFFDVKQITDAGHKKGCIVGFDLAHAVGNVELQLHDWEVDFACWCSYKYLNSGPGGIAGAFVHEKHANNFDLHRFGGWWGHDKKSRFEMDHVFQPIPGADGFQISNPPVLQTASLLASLNVFAKTSMKELRAKSDLLTAYLELLLLGQYGSGNEDDSEPPRKAKKLSNGYEDAKPRIRILSPRDPKQRGCQLSVSFSVTLDEVHSQLEKRGVVVDTRKPNVMRIAPTPLYNSFEDVYKFVELLGESFDAMACKKLYNGESFGPTVGLENTPGRHCMT